MGGNQLLASGKLELASVDRVRPNQIHSSRGKMGKASCGASCSSLLGGSGGSNGMSVPFVQLDGHSPVCCRTGVSNRDSRKSRSLHVCLRPAAVIGRVLPSEGKAEYSSFLVTAAVSRSYCLSSFQSRLGSL